MTDVEWACLDSHKNAPDSRFCSTCGFEREVEEPAPNFCGSCGSARIADAPFCPGCGSGFGADEAPTDVLTIASDDSKPHEVAPEDEPVEVTMRFVPTAAAAPAEPPAAAVPHSIPSPPVPAQATSNFGTRHVLLFCTALVIIIAAAVTAVVVVSHRSHGTSGRTAGKDGGSKAASRKKLAAIQPAVTQQVQVHDRLAAALQHVAPKPASLRTVHLLGASLARSSDAIQTRIDAAELPQSYSLPLRRALDADRDLGSAAAALPTDPDASFAGKLSPLASAAAQSTRAWQAVHDAQGTGSRVDASAAIQVLGAWTKQVGDLRKWTTQVEDVIAESSNGRRDLTSIFSQVSACNMTPDDGASVLDSVASNREAVLGQLDSVDSPDAASGKAIESLRRAIQHSHEADRAYAGWLRNETDWYYTEPVGCLGGAMPSNSDRVNGDSESELATSAKSEFVTRFNPIARRFNRRTWTEVSI